MRIKICGVNSAAAYDAACAAGADYVGFVFAPGSPRQVSADSAAALVARGGRARPVGLFVDPSEDDVAAVLATVPLAALQVYAPAAVAVALGARFAIPVWRSVGVETASDLPRTREGAAALVIEPRPPAGAARPGGLARRLDWRVLAGWRPGFPWWLAGGLRPDNVAQAIAVSGAAAVDVSSGVETAPGVKSPALIAAFAAAARGLS